MNAKTFNFWAAIPAVQGFRAPALGGSHRLPRRRPFHPGRSDRNLPCRQAKLAKTIEARFQRCPFFIPLSLLIRMKTKPKSVSPEIKIQTGLPIILPAGEMPGLRNSLMKGQIEGQDCQISKKPTGLLSNTKPIFLIFINFRNFGYVLGIEATHSILLS